MHVVYCRVHCPRRALKQKVIIYLCLANPISLSTIHAALCRNFASASDYKATSFTELGVAIRYRARRFRVATSENRLLPRAGRRTRFDFDSQTLSPLFKQFLRAKFPPVIKIIRVSKGLGDGRVSGPPPPDPCSSRTGMENLAGGINFLRLRIGARRCLKLAVVPKHEAERKWCRRKPAVLHPPRRIPSVRRFSRGPVFGARVHLARGGSGIGTRAPG